MVVVDTELEQVKVRIINFLRERGEPVAPGELNSQLVKEGYKDSMVRTAAVYLWDAGEIHWTSEANWHIGLDPWLRQFNPNFVSRYQ